jgi:hypothetical protein
VVRHHSTAPPPPRCAPPHCTALHHHQALIGLVPDLACVSALGLAPHWASHFFVAGLCLELQANAEALSRLQLINQVRRARVCAVCVCVCCVCVLCVLCVCVCVLCVLCVCVCVCAWRMVRPVPVPVPHAT